MFRNDYYFFDDNDCLKYINDNFDKKYVDIWNKLDKLKGGESQEDFIEANPLQKTDISIINIIILIVIVLISYGTGLFYTKSLTEFINNNFLSYTNIN